MSFVRIITGLMIVFFIVFAFSIQAPAQPNTSKQAFESNLQPYHDVAKRSQLIALGTIESIETKREIFGWAGDTPYYASFQYITLHVDRLLKGLPKINPIVIQSIRGSVNDPSFKQNERILAMVSWYEDKNHGNYYAFTMAGGEIAGRFSIESDNISSATEVLNTNLMGNKWHMDLDDFIADILNTNQ